MRPIESFVVQSGVSIQLGGTAGEGLETAGELLAQALVASGRRPATQRDFPSRIRGGDTTITVRVVSGGNLAPPVDVEVLMAFNDTVLPRMEARCAEGHLFLHDGDAHTPFPFTKMAKDVGAPRGKNMVALGVACRVLGLPIEFAVAAVERRFQGDVAVANVKALQGGFDAAAGLPTFELPEPELQGDVQWLSGNEAFALGAVAAGCRFMAAYPITPASDILEVLTPHLEAMGGIAVQMEDEMAALQACIGAGFAGASAMTATSGPGLSLMTESIGFAASAEVPVVIVDCQRPGPSTGMPTKHGQEDLLHMVYGGHGEDVRIVLAPADVADACFIASGAFQLAHRFRTAVFVALDQQLCLFKQAVPKLDIESISANMPVRATNTHEAADNAWDKTVLPYSEKRVPLPGEAGRFYANSTEHGPDGFTTELPDVRNAMVERRLAIQANILAAVPNPIVVSSHGDGRDAVLVSWGSTVGACREAAETLGVDVIGVRLLWPFPAEAFVEAVGGRDVVVVEANATGQLATIIRSETGLETDSILRYDGNPVSTKDIVEAMQ